MYLPVFLCLYALFWKGFESDQRLFSWLLLNIADYQMRFILNLYIYRELFTVQPIKRP